MTSVSLTSESSVRCFNGTQSVYSHDAASLGCRMRFAVYQPDVCQQDFYQQDFYQQDFYQQDFYQQDKATDAPCLIWLSGLTCTEENFITKAGAQRVAAELGIIIVAPDTSPRGEEVPDDPDGAYDFGLGAGFYVNATRSPWATHYQMHSYIETELTDLIKANLPVDPDRLGIFGHSMGGHGALTMALRNPQTYRSVSAFAPICSPIRCPWGQKALGNYLGDDQRAWRTYDACALIEDGCRVPAILVDQGLDDSFLAEQLKPELLRAACQTAGIPLELRQQPGYDHSYYFIASFIEDHLRWHHTQLTN